MIGKITKRTIKDTCVKTEQIGADEVGDKVMQDNRIGEDDAKFNFGTVPYHERLFSCLRPAIMVEQGYS